MVALPRQHGAGGQVSDANGGEGVLLAVQSQDWKGQNENLCGRSVQFFSESEGGRMSSRTLGDIPEARICTRVHLALKLVQSCDTLSTPPVPRFAAPIGRADTTASDLLCQVRRVSPP